MDAVWNETPKARWDRLAARGGAAVQQDWAYGAAMAAMGAGVARAVVTADGAPAALAQFTARRIGPVGWMLCSRGPVWLQDLSATEKAAALRALRKSAPGPRLNAVFFTLEEGAASDAPAVAGLRRVMTGYATAELDLTAPPDALRKAMKQKWRNRLNAAERAAPEIRTLGGGPDRWRWLLAHEDAQRKEKGYKALPTAFTENWSAANPRSGVEALEARVDGAPAPVAAMLFLRHGRIATYHIGWCGPQGRRTGAHCLLLWRAMAHLCGLGVERIDMGGVDTESGAGVARFKLGSGAVLKTLCGTYI